MTTKRFPYLHRGQPGDPFGFAPLLPIRLTRDAVMITELALVDSGASMNTLPYSLGLRFGVDWNSLPMTVQLGGGKGAVSAKLLAVDGLVAGFPAVQLLFAWAQTDSYPLLLGQSNFFMIFDVCFHRTQSHFELTKRP